MLIVGGCGLGGAYASIFHFYCHIKKKFDLEGEKRKRLLDVCLKDLGTVFHYVYMYMYVCLSISILHVTVTSFTTC